jgi:enoyl-CoA hydratase
MYLALTGRAIGRADAYRFGLATHCVPAACFPEIKAAVAAADPVDPVLDQRHEDPGPGELAPLEEVIERCFSAETVEEVVARLQAERGAEAKWAEEVLRDLAQCAPASLKVTLRHVHLARESDLRATLIQDYRLARRFMDNPDFYEGVRANLIDRDRAPKWQPARIEDVTDAMVDAYFAGLGPEDLQLPSRAEMQAIRS